MDKQKIDMFLAQHGEKFPAERLNDIKAKLEGMSDDKFMVLSATSFKDPSTMLIISILAGSIGVDRFMLGDTGLGILKLLTGGGCYIWWLIDIINIKKMTRQKNYDKFMMSAGM